MAATILDTNSAKCGVLVKTTTVDYPGRVASAFFLRGCNLRCPYCQNAALVTGGEGEEDGTGKDTPALCSVDELFAHMEKRRGVINALVLSGGEPLVTPTAGGILRRAKAMGLRVKLDTNGTLPDALQRIVKDDSTRPDFIAMDIKTAPARYGELGGGTALRHCERSEAISSRTEIASRVAQGGRIAMTDTDTWKAILRRSISIIASYPADCREWRTVLVPGLVGESDIDIMAAMLPADASWQFAQFRPGGCISPDYDALLPMTDSDAAALVARAKRVIPGSVLR